MQGRLPGAVSAKEAEAASASVHILSWRARGCCPEQGWWDGADGGGRRGRGSRVQGGVGGTKGPGSESGRPRSRPSPSPRFLGTDSPWAGGLDRTRAFAQDGERSRALPPRCPCRHLWGRSARGQRDS